MSLTWDLDASIEPLLRVFQHGHNVHYFLFQVVNTCREERSALAQVHTRVPEERKA
jgi:hypothetical protein